MILSIDKERMQCTVELYRASTSDNVRVLSWWTTHKDEADYYARQNNSIVRSRTIVVPIRSVVKGAMGHDLVQFKVNNQYIYGTRGSYRVAGIDMGIDELPMWIDGDVLDVFTVRDEMMYYSADSCIVFCLGKNVADRVLAFI